MSRSSSYIYEDNPLPTVGLANGNPPAIDVYEERKSSVDSVASEVSLNEDGTPAAPNQLVRDKFGFLVDPQAPATSDYENLELLRSRERKWLEMLNDWPQYMTRNFDKIRSRCRKGIPASLRARGWMMLCGAHYLMNEHSPDESFETLDSRPCDPVVIDEIKRDLDRQFPNHELFSIKAGYGKSGQEDLFRVLKAWTVLHPEEGYCQGQAPIAATLLMHMPVNEAFYCFVQICHKYLPGYYSHGLKAIQFDGQILEGLLKKFSPSTYHHFKKQGIDPVLYMVEWFMCIFCRTLPWPTVLRVWDMFFCEGVKILFKVAVVMLKYGLSERKDLKKCPSMFETMERVKNLPPRLLREEFLIRKVVELNLTEEDLEHEHYKKLKEQQKKSKKSV